MRTTCLVKRKLTRKLNLCFFKSGFVIKPFVSLLLNSIAMIFKTGLNDIMYKYTSALGFMQSLAEDEITRFNEMSNNFSSQSVYNPSRKQSL